MKTMTSTKAKTNFGALLDMAQHEPVGILRNNRMIAVVISYQEYQWYQKQSRKAKKLGG